MANKNTYERCGNCVNCLREKTSYGNIRRIKCKEGIKSRITGNTRACETHFEHKDKAKDGQYCGFFKREIRIVGDGENKQIAPCYGCNIRCRYAYPKDERDYIEEVEEATYAEEQPQEK